MHMAYPFRINRQGRSTLSSGDNYIRQLIEQVLFTSPGERINRPDFGSGLMQMVFAPNSNEIAATVQTLIQANLQRWLGDLIVIEAAEVESEDNKLIITIRYLRRETQEIQVEQFVQEI